MSVSTTVKRYGIEQAIKFMYKDPEKNLPKLMDWADTFCKGRFPVSYTHLTLPTTELV